MNLAAKFSELACDKLGRAVLLETELGVGVKVAAPSGHFAVKQIDEMWDLHDERLRDGMLKFEASTLGDARK
jgi:hypothetical protein